MFGLHARHLRHTWHVGRGDRLCLFERAQPHDRQGLKDFAQEGPAIGAFRLAQRGFAGPISVVEMAAARLLGLADQRLLQPPDMRLVEA